MHNTSSLERSCHMAGCARLTAISLALLFVLGCSSSSSSGSSKPASSGGSANLPVQVDGKPSGFTASFLAFFPSKLEAHAGDTIQFKLVDTGEPHTVTLGKLVDAGLAAQAKSKDPTGAEVPELAKLPTLIPNDIADPKTDANQTAANPCFLDSGDPPANAVCTKRSQPEFSGSQSLYSSGWLSGDTSFDVKLASNIQPGVYMFLCLLHRGAMTGQFTVVDKSKTIPTAEQVK